jgi:pimeloyl-ACP methyl ester carboxylesterase
MDSTNVRRSVLSITGYDGAAVPNTFLRQRGETEHLGILLPGFAYGCDRPLLYYPGRLLDELGADVLRLEAVYTLDAPPASGMVSHELVRRVQADAAAVSRAALAKRPYRRLTIVGKSLGTLAMTALLALSGLPETTEAVWLTPVLGVLLERRQLAPLAASRVRSLVAIGTSDPFYDEARLAQWRAATGAEEEVVVGADHALEIPGDVVASVQELERLMRAMRAFLVHA